MKKTLIKILFVSLLLCSESYAASILLSPSNTGSIDVASRLTGLGHSVTVSDPTTWGSVFDYSPFDVVGFQYDQDGNSNPADIAHLVNSVSSEDIGVLFFRGNGATQTGVALGLFSNIGSPSWVSPANLNVLNNTHVITQHMTVGIQNLGFTYMSDYQSVGIGSGASVLATTSSGAPALIVHDSARVAALPFYGHFSGFESESFDSITLTDNAINWASSPASVPEPSSPMLFGMAAMAWLGLQMHRRKGHNRVAGD